MKKTKFFLGANSDNGFKSYFEKLQGQDNSLQLLILKGGAGSGKSSLMKRVLSFAQEMGHKLEIIPCASDPSSLDAVIDHTQNFAIMDGTAPHVIDPNLAGVDSHILYTGDLWDMKKLRSKKEEITPIAQTISDCHKSATSYVKSASALLRENMEYADKFINREAADVLAKKIMAQAFSAHHGSEKERLLSAVSVGEIVFFEESVFSLCDKVYVLSDKFGAFSNYILSKIRLFAREENQEFISCPCSIMKGKYDHLIFPESKVAIVTENDFMKFESGEKIDAESFYHQFALGDFLQKRLALAQEILPLAAESVKKAKLLHDELEKYYIEAMDFGGMEALFVKILYHFYDHFPQKH